MSAILVSRGGVISSSAAGAEPVNFLTDLVFSWDFTAGPDDLHTNNLDLAETGGPTFSYGANGVTVDSGTGFMTRAWSALLLMGDSDWLLSAEFRLPAEFNQTQYFPGTDDSSLSFGIGDAGEITGLITPDNSNYFPVTVNVPSADVHHHYAFWYDHSTDALSISVDGGAAVTSTVAGGVYNSGAPGTVEADVSAGGYLRNLRMWKGANALTVAVQRSWLANVSGGAAAGRTYAALAAGM
jgi:hypothetical protein